MVFYRDYSRETSHSPFHVTISRKRHMVLSMCLYQRNIAWSFPRDYTTETSHCPFHVTIPIQRSHINSLIISSMSSTPFEDVDLFVMNYESKSSPFSFPACCYNIYYFIVLLLVFFLLFLTHGPYLSTDLYTMDWQLPS